MLNLPECSRRNEFFLDFYEKEIEVPRKTMTTPQIHVTLFFGSQPDSIGKVCRLYLPGLLAVASSV